MSLFGPLLTAPRAQSLENPAVPLTSTSLLDWMGHTPNASGIAVNETSSLHMPAVWRAVNLIAGTAAALPLHAYKTGDEQRKIITSGQSADLLNFPHPDLVPFDFWELIYAHRLLWGNAYVLKLRNALGQIKELWPIHPSRVKVGRVTEQGAMGDSTQIGRKIYAVDGGYDQGGLTYYDDQIMHLPGFGYDGVCGISPIRMAAQGIGLGLAAEEYGARLFGSGSLATGILQTEQRLKPEQADALHRRWREKATGISRAHEAVVLDSGVKFHQLTIPPEDAQFLQSRKFQVVEIARMFGMPPHMLMEVDGSTSWGTGIEQMTLGFVIFTLQSWLIRTEQRVTQVLRPQNVYAKYALAGLLRGDSAARAEFYTKLWNLGVFSTNDIRRFEELAPVEGGDVRYRPLNMGILGTGDTNTVDPTNPNPATAATTAARQLLVGAATAVELANPHGDPELVDA